MTEAKIESPLRLAAVIPALNEGGNIKSVVDQVMNCALAIVVDDGSTDDTANLARSAGATVVSHSVNKGYDAALETGIRTAIELGCSHVVTLDADGQHDPTLLDRFTEEFNKGTELIVGIRDHKQRWSEVLFCFVGQWFWGLKDPLCGMKGYKLTDTIDKNKLNTYNSIGTELAFRLIRDGITPHQFHITTRARKGRSRFGSGFLVNFKIFKAIIFSFVKIK